MEDIRNLLNQINILSIKNREIQNAAGSRFNMFKVCGVNRYENTHSAIIAEFLDPNGTHGLKSKLLERFFELFVAQDIRDVFRFETAYIKTEYSMRDGRIDIFITDNCGYAIIIENKIDAVDQWEQLKRYEEYAKSNYKKHQIFYLTLDGDKASEQSGLGVDYSCISYREHILKWMEDCVALAVHFPMVRETINQYVNHLKGLTNQDMDTKHKEEIVKIILDNPNFIESIKEIADNKIWEKCRLEIVNRLKSSVIQIANKLSLEYHIDSGLGNNDTGFWFKKSEWSYSILFWFDDINSLYVGIDDYKLPDNTKCSDEMVRKLKEFCALTFKEYADVKMYRIWGVEFQAWSDCSWTDINKEMPAEIETVTTDLLKKLVDFQKLVENVA